MFLWIPELVVYSAAVYPYGIKTLLANGWSAFLINGKSVFSNGPRSLLRNPLVCIIFDIWVFDNCILAKKIFSNILLRFATCLLVSNNLSKKLVLSLELQIIFDERYIVTLVSFSVADFNLLSCKSDKFIFILLSSPFYFDIILKQNKCIRSWDLRA